MPHKSRTCLAALGLVVLFSGPALALVTPQQKCVIARDRAAGTKLSAVMTCYAKAKRKAVAVDPACLAKAQSKFDAAAAKGGSSCGGTVADVDATLEVGIARVLAAVPGSGLCPYKWVRSAAKNGSAVIRCKERLVKGSIDNSSGVSVDVNCEVLRNAKLFNELYAAGMCGDAARVAAGVFSLADTLFMRGMSVVAPGACGTFVASWYVPQMNDLVVDVNGDVLAAATGSIQRFHNDGTFVSAFGEPGFGDDQFLSGYLDVAVDESGDIYVLDAGRVKKFASDGTFLTAWGSVGAGDGQFDTPYRIAADSAGGVWVAAGIDPPFSSFPHGPSRIQHFDANGTFLAMWSEVRTPDLTLGANGDLFLTDSGSPVGSSNPPSVGRVQRLLGDGTPLATWDAAGSPVDPYSTPGEVTADSAGNVYVAIPNRNLIRRFVCP